MTVIAILLSDIHLSHSPPIARNNEPNWYAAMERQLTFLKELQKQHENPPIIVAGDIFHRWNSPPELINFALQEFPVMYSIAGQHDMPYHNFFEVKKSAYWTLVEAGKLIDIPYDKPYKIQHQMMDLVLYGFPFGFPLKPNLERDSDVVTVAVIHDYCWRSGFSYFGAPEEKSVEGHCRLGMNYDVLHFGDNHKGFLKRFDDQWIFNGGTFYRRAIDELDYRPRVGLVVVEFEDDRFEIVVKPVYVPVEEDILSVKVQEAKSEVGVEIGNFVDYLSTITLNSLDIEGVIRQYTEMNSVRDAVRVEIMKLLECTHHG
jgi:DNA repair exonuclease SbcCD nuclease subunit